MVNNIRIVSVDGPAGSGKSSVSKEVARRIGLKYIDSGAIYRAITWYILEIYGKVERNRGYLKDIENAGIEQRFLPDGMVKTYLNGDDISDKIRNEVIAKNIGIISDDPSIRNYINSILREWGKKDAIIMDGRDIGTVVFPDADIKIYLDASVEQRALRRILEYKEMGKTVDESAVKNQIIQRDSEDKNRPFGSLKKADDAVYIDTSSMDKEDVIKKIIEIISY